VHNSSKARKGALVSVGILDDKTTHFYGFVHHATWFKTEQVVEVKPFIPYFDKFQNLIPFGMHRQFYLLHYPIKISDGSIDRACLNQ
jgi:hypothetical protein